MRLAGMAKLEAPEVADLLLEIGRRASLEGGNPYKAKAYIRAAESLRSLVIPLGEIICRSELRAIPGIEDGIARRIIQLRDKGTDDGLERLRRNFPGSLLELLSIPRLKPSVILKLHKELGINSAADAEVAAQQGRLRKVKGLGASVERKILEGLALARSAEGQLRVNRAEELLLHAGEQLKRQGATHVTIAGIFGVGASWLATLGWWRYRRIKLSKGRWETSASTSCPGSALAAVFSTPPATQSTSRSLRNSPAAKG